jgi:serine protease AprX
LLVTGVLPAQQAQAPLSAIIEARLNATGRADFFVVLKDDPAGSVLEEAKGVHEHGARRKFIIEKLQKKTFQSQNDLGYWLLKQGASYQHFWIVNQVLVKNGTPELLRQIRARKDVARVDANPSVQLQVPPITTEKEATPAAPTAMEWNISRIKADQVWSIYGVTGAGVVVAVNDSGVMWTHEALKNQYRGWNGITADHTYSWHDAIHSTSHASSCGANTPEPCDDSGHGTHVAGILAGHTWANQIGVAPGAKWIACRNMDNGFGTPASYLECLQWFLAPEGDAARAPDIINNSWTCPPSEGCNQGTLETAVNTVTAAGILMVVANGNDGFWGCASTLNPPALYRASFSVGATDSNDSLADFSSRGPVTYNGQTYKKPDISAPGVNIRSADYNGAYTTMSGTSVASPHAAGAAALLWSGLPRLRHNIDATEQLLERKARPKNFTSCGDGLGVPNNGYGYGIIDVLSAYRQSLASDTSPYLLLLLD